MLLVDCSLLKGLLAWSLAPKQVGKLWEGGKGRFNNHNKGFGEALLFSKIKLDPGPQFVGTC